jgi:hypothetical protein
VSKPSKKTTDMSLPPEERRRKRQQGRIAAAPSAQMSHGTSPRGRRVTRDGLRWLAVEERLREDAAAFAEGTAEPDEDVFIGRVLHRTAEDEDGQENPVNPWSDYGRDAVW